MVEAIPWMTAGVYARYGGLALDLSPEERLRIQTDAVLLERSVGRTRPAVFGLFSSVQDRWDRVLALLDRSFPNGGGTAFLLERPDEYPPALRHRFYFPSDASGEAGVFFGTLHFAGTTVDALNRPPWRLPPPPADVLLLGGRGMVADGRMDRVTEMLHPAVVAMSSSDGPRIRRRGGVAELRLDEEGEVYALVTYDPEWKCLEAAFHLFGEEDPFLRQIVSLRRRERIESLLRERYRPRDADNVVAIALSLAADYLTFLEEDPDRTKDEREKKLADLWRGLPDEAIRLFLRFLQGPSEVL